MTFKSFKLEWFGKIPSEWGMSKIKYIHAQTQNSFTDGDWIESPEIEDSGIRYITTGNIGEGKFKHQGNGFISEKTFERLNCTEIFAGDLLISRLSPPVGRSCIIPDLGCRVIMSVDNVVLRLKKDFSKEFYNYIFNSVLYFEHTNTLSRGSTLTRISRNILGNIKVLVPPIKEQNLISQYLNKKTQNIDSFIEKIENKIELLKENKSVTIKRYLTKGLDSNIEMKESGVEWIGKIPKNWNLKRVKYLCDISTGGKDTQDNVEGGEYPFFVRSPKIERINSFSFDGEAVLTSGDGAGVGKIFHYFNGKFDYHQRVYKFSNFNKIEGRFFYWFFKEYFSYEILRWNAKSTVDSVRLPLIQNFPIIIPPIQIQKNILEVIETYSFNVDELITKLKRKTELLKEYRQSQISSVVTGKIRITEDKLILQLPPMSPRNMEYQEEEQEKSQPRLTFY